MTSKLAYRVFVLAAVAVWGIAQVTGTSPFIGYAALALIPAVDLLLRRRRRQAEGR